ncbi:hypothetical protein GCM10027259_60990 [Micromonospora palomenae]
MDGNSADGAAQVAEGGVKAARDGWEGWEGCREWHWHPGPWWPFADLAVMSERLTAAHLDGQSRPRA